MMRTRAKICGLTRPQDIQSAVHAGADAIGLVFYPPSPRSVTAEQAKALMQHIPAYVQSVGLFVNASADEILAVLKEAPLDMLQFHGDETPDECESYRRPYIKALRVKPGDDLVAACQAYSKAKLALSIPALPSPRRL